MEIKRKIQLSAVAVIANGLLALGAAAPRPAIANSCSSHTYFNCDCSLSCNSVPGCTLSTFCGYGMEECLGFPTRYCIYN